MSELADRALQEFAEKEPDDPPLQAHEAARLCRWFLAGFDAGRSSRTPGPATAEVLHDFKAQLDTWDDPGDPGVQNCLADMLFRLRMIRAFLAEWPSPAE